MANTLKHSNSDIMLTKNKYKKINYFFEMVERNDIKGIKMFLDKYPDFKEHSKYLVATNGWHPWLFAARFGYKDMLEYFINTFKLNRNRPDGQSSRTNENIMNNLVLLAIHSGSLETIYYLSNFITLDNTQLHAFYKNTVTLDKMKLSLYFLVKGTFITDLVTPVKFQHKASAFTYNCYYTGSGDNIKYFNKKGEEIKEKNDVMMILSEAQPYRSNNLNDHLKIIRLFINFNEYLIIEIEKKKSKTGGEKSDEEKRFYNMIKGVKSSEYLNNMVEKYF